MIKMGRSFVYQKWVIDFRGLQYLKESILSSMFEFKNLDLCSFYDIDNDIPISADKPLKNQAFTAVNTFDRNSVGSQDEFFYQKQSHLLTESYEISFEKDFMKEHQAVFKRQLQNYMESFRTYQKINGIKPYLETQNISSKENHAATCIDFIRSHTLGLCFEETQTFVKKFTTYDKLSEFLNIVARSAPEKISIQLIQVAREILEKYEGVKIENPSEKELLKIAQSVFESFKFAELAEIKAANLVNTVEVIESSKKFLEVFCATCMLVIAQYFQNPFSSLEGSLKRPLFSSNSEEEQQEISQLSQSSKKRKFSF